MYYTVKKNCKSTATVILAGGLSSRMGSNKAFLSINGIHFVDHVISILKKVGLETIFISGCLPDYDCILDQNKNLGPMEGVRSSINYLKNSNYSNLLFIQVDIPLINEVLMNKFLLNYFENNINYYTNFPLPFIVKMENALSVLCINNNLYSIYSFLNALKCSSIDPSFQDSYILKGVNNPLELELLNKYLKENLK